MRGSAHSQPVHNAQAFALIALLLALIGVMSAGSLVAGSARLTLQELWAGAWGHDERAALILYELRLPRLVLALGVGAFMGLAGAAIQGLSRNPLAEPGLLGTPQAAALGAVLLIYTGSADAASIALPFAGMAGALLAMLAILAMARRVDSALSLLLVGLMIGSLCSAAISIVLSLSSNPYAVTEIVFWLMGSFTDRSWRHVAMAMPCIIAGAFFLFACGPTFRALTLGETTARSLGFDPQRATVLTTIGISLGTGGATAVAGAIGFIGLIAPHLMRPFVGSDPQRVLWPSALAGALLAVTADLLTKVIPATAEIRVGALLALVGAPGFLYVALVTRTHARGRMP